MFDIEKLLKQRLPSDSVLKKQFFKPMVWLLKKILHQHEFKAFDKKYPHVKGFDFVDQVLDYFNASYSVRDTEQERIPSQGRVVIIANHPIGSLDGLALLKLVRSVRHDVKIVANEILMGIKNIQPCLLAVDNMTGNTNRESVMAIRKHLNQDAAVIVFPAGVVSRLTPKGVRDGKWNAGFLRFAASTQSPVLPIYITARNSIFFYILSIISRPLSTIWLVPEMFKHRNRCIPIRVGDLIPYESYANNTMPRPELVSLFQRHLYRVAKKTPGIFETTRAIAHPEDHRIVRQEIKSHELLGETTDGKQIYLCQCNTDSSLMRELGRIREVTFRAVGEGTGRRRDTDYLDLVYNHLILWDDDALEIAGAYRISDTRSMNHATTEEQLYSSRLFTYREEMNAYLAMGLELGRSFVQPRYWGRRSLDYLWQGIGALLKRNPQYRYLFGAVSISDTYPLMAKNMLVYFYQKHYGTQKNLVEATAPFSISKELSQELERLFPGSDYKKDFRELKSRLKHMNCSVPTLFKQYAELCDPGGVIFADFGLDFDFNKAVDGFVIVDTYRLLAHKRE
ncbi:MAG: lysophospholipid acyltransferase family protein, partial [Pseudomonadota bacterium]